MTETIGNTGNFAEKFSSEIDERFSLSSITETAINDKFDFKGVNTVRLYSIDTAPLNDYNMNASSNRYGVPVELSSETEEMTLTKDKSFSFSIDRRNREDNMMSHDAGEALEREIREVISPYIDTYRLKKLVDNAPSIKIEDITDTTAYTSLIDTSTTLFDKKVPVDGRIAFVSPWYYKCIKLDKNFTKNGDKGLNIAINGAVGMVDKTTIIVAPTEYLPDGVNYIVTHPIAMVSPKKFSDYKIHENVPGINGWLVEDRLYFDAFVFRKKRWAICVSKAVVQDVTITVKLNTSAAGNVEISIGGKTVYTDGKGVAVVKLPKGTYTLTALMDGYQAVNESLTVTTAAVTKTITFTTP